MFSHTLIDDKVRQYFFPLRYRFSLIDQRGKFSARRSWLSLNCVDKAVDDECLAINAAGQK